MVRLFKNVVTAADVHDEPIASQKIAQVVEGNVRIGVA